MPENGSVISTGFKDFESAQRTLAGIELVNIIRKNQMHNDENVKLFKELFIRSGSTQLWGKLVFNSDILFIPLLWSMSFCFLFNTNILNIYELINFSCSFF